jgi:hypothetical protein
MYPQRVLTRQAEKWTRVSPLMLDKKAGDFNLKPKISFDSESRSVSFMLNVEYETPNFNATLFVASTFGKCDPELGTAIVGTAHAKVEYAEARGFRY